MISMAVAKKGRMAVDMTTGSPTKVLIMFALPMIFSNIFQQFYNIVDMLVVGNQIGSNALAAISTSSPISSLFIFTAMGLTTGAGVVISQYFGAKQLANVKTSINTMLTFAFIAGLVLTAVGILLSPIVLRWINTPEEIMDDAVTYLRIYFAGALFLFLYNTLNSSYNALGNSRTPLYFLILSSLLNVVLDLWFVIGLRMGVGGAALATTLAQGVSAILSFINMRKRLREMETDGPVKLFDKGIFKTIMRIAIPNALQQSIISLGMVFIQSSINSFGAAVMAGVSAAGRVDSLSTMPLSNVGNAFGSYAGQNIGAGRIDRVKQGLRSAVLFSIIAGGIMCVILQLLAPQIISMFCDSADPNFAEMVDIGVRYVRVISVFAPVFGIFMVMMSMLRGAGDMKSFLTANFTNFTFRVLMALFVAPIFGPHIIWWATAVGWSLAVIISVAFYRKGDWQKKSVIKKA
ncbi:MAG: MATE family efflux transporter [Ruminococcaceae bacterium]|nr:MATE family efflux transporter [Oscillospiraceae bacterium]